MCFLDSFETLEKALKLESDENTYVYAYAAAREVHKHVYFNPLIAALLGP